MREPLVKRKTYQQRMIIKSSEITMVGANTIRLMDAFDRAVVKARQLALDTEMTAIFNHGEEQVQVKGITMRKLE